MSDRRRESEDLRKQMAEADADILETLEKRARLARRLGELGTGVPPGPSEREQFSLLEKAASENLPGDAIRAVFREVHAATASLERAARVAFAGPDGGFCQVAARQHFGPGAELVVSEGAPQALDEVTRRRADFAVVPFESSTDGPVHASVEALAATELMLVAKIELAAVLSVMSRNGNRGDIDKLYVHGPDRIRAQRFVASMQRSTVVDVPSPLVAAQLAAEDHGGAAIVPQSFGEGMGLNVVQPNVGERADVRLRFGLVGARPAWRSGNDMTSLLFGVHDEPGALFDVLRHFAERGINLKTIQSRPMPGETWNYLFYVEVTGHVTDRPVVTALEEIKRKTRTLKVLGSFPA
jgi:chorismate mutase / prephenate dehydratase